MHAYLLADTRISQFCPHEKNRSEHATLAKQKQISVPYASRAHRLGADYRGGHQAEKLADEKEKEEGDVRLYTKKCLNPVQILFLSHTF